MRFGPPNRAGWASSEQECIRRDAQKPVGLVQLSDCRRLPGAKPGDPNSYVFGQVAPVDVRQSDVFRTVETASRLLAFSVFHLCRVECGEVCRRECEQLWPPDLRYLVRPDCATHE